MTSKIYISLLYAFAFTVWPPDNGKSQVKELPDTAINDPFDSADFYELQAEKINFKYVAGSTKNIQREAIKNLSILEKRAKRKRIDTVYLSVLDTMSIDTFKHKRGLFYRIFH